MRTTNIDFIQKPQSYSNSYLEKFIAPKIEESIANEYLFDFTHYRKQLKQLSENELTNQIIVPLLQKMKFYPVVQATQHGQLEQGTDLLPFYEMTPFGGRRYYGVQIKAHDISGNSRDPNNITVLLTQAEDAQFSQS